MLDGKDLSQFIPLASPLPPVPEGEIFTADQWATLISICEIFIPKISHEATTASKEWPEYDAAVAEIRKFATDGVSDKDIQDFLQESFSYDDLKASLHRRIKQFIPKSLASAMGFVLAALNTRIGLYMLAGTGTPLQSLSIAQRTRIVLSWSTSYLAPLRGLFRSMEMLAKLSWLPQSSTLHTITGFPEIPKHVDRSEGYPFDFKDFADSSDSTIELDYDVVIVGSGCGAGVVASHLARATASMVPKPRIALLEKSYHFPTSHFPMTSSAAGEHLLEAGGGLQADNGSIAVIAGSTWGGGGTVNWSASLQPQHFVREEWEQEGLDLFTSSEFQDCLDTICERMGVCKMTDELAKHEIPHSYANKVILEGSRRLGLTAEVVPQNSASKAHSCGYCSEGCAGATKQGPANCWLPDAAEHGVEFIEGCFTEEVLWDHDSSSPSKKRAYGVKALWSSRDRKTKRKIIIKSKRVIVSAGTLQSPALLIRSGITNRNVGANLHLHPTLCVGTVWREEIRPWEGPILTTAMTSFENVDGLGHGPKVEIIAGTPSYMLPWTTWNPQLSIDAVKSGRTKTNENTAMASALDYKVQIAKYGHTAGMIAIQRDRDTGRVYLEPRDPDRRQIRIDYTPSARDQQGLLEGVLAASRIAYAMGALEIRPYSCAIAPFCRSETATDATNDQAFKSWLQQARLSGVHSPLECTLGSAHQMGTCRMSADKDRGVVDSQGRVWETQGLYVADASVFPSASGVNPMVTTMGIAEWIGRGIVSEIKAEAT